MSEFEKELREALRRKDPPAGFAERVLARIPDPPRRTTWISRWVSKDSTSFRFSWAPVTAVLVLSCFGAGVFEYGHVRRQRQEGERARAELVFALELTAAKLQATKARLLRPKGGNL